MGRLPFAALLGVVLGACRVEEPPPPAFVAPPEPALRTDFGVDASSRTIAVGALNDESGPAATIGKPFADGKRLLAARIEGGISGLLPPGWTIRLVERDHGYDPDRAVRAYEEIEDHVLYIGTVFGTPVTAPLQPLIQRDGILAFPASLSSEMGRHVHTPPLAPSYRIEAMRAVDWIARQNPSARIGLVLQDDDYGNDSRGGLEAAAKHRKLRVAATEVVEPGQHEFGPVIAGLRRNGCTHVVLATLPSATGPLLRTAATEGYTPTWIGHTPAWSDRFFDPRVLSPSVFAGYRQLSVLPYWGEDVPGMTEFLATWDAWADPLAEADSTVLASYAQGLVQVEAARRAIASGDATRAGYLAALRSIDGFDAGGLVQPVSFGTFPYEVGTKARLLKPDFAARSWTVVSPYAEPTALSETASAEPP